MLENPRSGRVRAVARLATKQARADAGLFLAEGPQAVREALRFRPDLVADVFATAAALERHREIAEACDAAGLPMQEVSTAVLQAMADTVTPQGFVAVCRQFPATLAELFMGSPKLVAVLNEVRDPGNAGTIVRAADASGADAVVFAGDCVDIYNPKAVRSTTGSLFHVPVVVGVALVDVIDACRAAGVQTVGADISGEDLLGLRMDGGLDAPTAWVFGNEARGLPDAAIGACDRVAAVPIYGSAESLNLATAASVCLYETAFAQRSRAAGSGPTHAAP